MSKVYIFFILMAVVMLMPSCKKHKRIPDEVLQEIITESLITDAIIGDRRGQSKTATNFPDTLDYYKPIAEKYGYDMADVQYTFEYMATRKSSPLTNILINVTENIDRQRQRANYIYHGALKFDTLALDHLADTVYRNNDTIRGKIGDYHILILNPRQGTYSLLFDYSATNYQLGSKYVIHRLASSDKSISPVTGTFWIRNTTQKGEFNNKIIVDTEVFDTLKIEFKDPARKNIPNQEGVKIEPDTSYIYNIRLVHHPAAEQAREEYLYSLTGFTKPLDSIYEERYFLWHAQDSLPLHTGGVR